MSGFSILLALSFVLGLVGYLYLMKISPEVVSDHSNRRYLKSAKVYVGIGLTSQFVVILLQLVLYWVLAKKIYS